MTTNDFIKRAKDVHNNYYTYSRTIYINKNEKVIITCPIHGDFQQLPFNHLRGNKCPLCAIEAKKNNTDFFIKRMKELYGNKYSFEKTIYVSNKEKVIITHKELGDLETIPNKILSGTQPMCVKIYEKKIKLQNELLQKFYEKYGEEYSIQWEGFLTKKTKVKLTCIKHGEISIIFDTLFKKGCPFCNGYTFKYTENEFIRRSKEKYGEKYTVMSKFIDLSKPIEINCQKHGLFSTTPYRHLKNEYGGCKKCSNEAIKQYKTLYDFDEVVKIGNKIHSKKYLYDESTYNGHSEKFKIECPLHGEFYKNYYSHIILGQGCPKCQSSKMEQELILEFVKRGIEFIHQYSPKWLGKKKIDIFLPKYNLAIECQGSQHFYPSSLFGGEKGFKKQILSDKDKKELCEKNYVRLIYYSSLDIDFPYKVYTNINELINKEINENII